jgi:hypothetical protein
MHGIEEVAILDSRSHAGGCGIRERLRAGGADDDQAEA